MNPDSYINGALTLLACIACVNIAAQFLQLFYEEWKNCSIIRRAPAEDQPEISDRDVKRLWRVRQQIQVQETF